MKEVSLPASEDGRLPLGARFGHIVYVRSGRPCLTQEIDDEAPIAEAAGWSLEVSHPVGQEVRQGAGADVVVLPRVH